MIITCTFQIMTMLIIGGMGTPSGPIVGATSLIALRYALKPVEKGLQIYGLIELIYATLLIAIMLWKPEGIMGKRHSRMS